MTNFKKCKLVMLPSNEKAENCLVILNNGKLAYHKGYITQEYLCNVHSSSHHLYFLSDSEESNEPCWHYNVQTKNVQFNESSSWNRKIIATTNPELNLPIPSKEFIDVFISEYNKGCPIESCIVEYEEFITVNYGMVDHMEQPPTDWRLKTDKQNTITIRKIKNSWSREEVIPILRKAFEDSCKYSSFNEFISDNL